MSNRKYMELAIELAEKARGFTNPNPLVGAVIVKEDRIIGRGYHEKYGQLHAERNALASCTEDPKGAVMYVTLEPCCHYGKTPPCTEAIIAGGLSKVFIGSRDPNPLVSGKGVKMLQDAGIEVTTDFMKEECDALNPVFFHFITHQTPYVVMKYAMTMDGKIATVTGASKWITGEKARENVHRDRHHYAAIMAGKGTIIKDDPLLTCRINGGKHPIRIICDSQLTIPITAKVVTTTAEAATIIATSCRDKDRQQPYIDQGCRILEIPLSADNHLSLPHLMKDLAADGIDSILLEGGGALNWSALEAGIVNKVQTYIAPKIFGGETAKTPVAGVGVALPSQAYQLVNPKFTAMGDDILIESEVLPCSQE
ncbi:bifunctional diaminohydroxyphosphoribosylaminopyrimidine deaminase/5-amino-6-(5-phosphoribosylamino)uracil reductase RibD [Emergencia timonensis]|uniref:bifunctional diaminohydroxyphosphoribosylaminopyrimidine deaminase/5-amino-6-(5-phosphoribosylamino)uracil reductase RibD n=1 Tax=Emergencia timonensis TaxID=1776384 RepID=UPI0039913EF5